MDVSRVAFAGCLVQSYPYPGGGRIAMTRTDGISKLAAGRASLALAILVLFHCFASDARSQGISVQDQRLVITLDGRSFSLAARVYRPAGPGPFPMVVINHGSPFRASDAPSMGLSFGRQAEWFVSQGFAVVVALRPGFGDSDGPFMERAIGPCGDRDYVREGQQTAAIESAIATSGASLPGIDGRRIVV